MLMNIRRIPARYALVTWRIVQFPLTNWVSAKQLPLQGPLSKKMEKASQQSLTTHMCLK